MELRNAFTVRAPVDQAWDVITDAERVAPCLPGASLTGQQGEDYLGKMKVKIGPIRADFSGKVRFLEQDSVARRVVLDARGKEARGLGNASAKITVDLGHRDGGTHIEVVTNLDISGRVAQFGRNSLEDVSQRMLSQFAASLESLLDEAEAEAAASSSGEADHDSGGTSEREALAPTTTGPTRTASDDYFDIGREAWVPSLLGAVAAVATAIAVVMGIRVSRRRRTRHA